MKMKLICFAVLASALLTGCQTYQTKDVNLKESNYGTRSVINPKKIIINKKYRNIDRVKFVVLRTKNNDDYRAYYEFMKTNLLRIGFRKVVSESEFAQMIIKNGLENQVGSTYDLVQLHKINRKIGPFIVITTALNHTGDAWWDNQVIIVDPEQTEVLVKIHDYKPNWVDLDQEFNYPTINFLNDWYKSSK